MTAGQPLLITFGLYLVAMILIGLWAWRSTQSFDDCILGGRSLGSVVTARSAGASDMSGWLLSLFWARMTRNGAFAGMVAGAVTVILWKEIAVAQHGSQLYEMVPGVISACVAILLVSRIGKAPSDEVQFRHKGVMETLKVHGY